MSGNVAINTEASAKNRFERCHPTNIYALATISEIELGYYRKAHKEVSKTLMEAVPECRTISRGLHLQEEHQEDSAVSRRRRERQGEA